MKKRVGLLASVASMLMLSAILVACSAGQGQAQLTGADVVQKVREAMRSDQSAQGTIELSATINKAGIKSLIGGFMPESPKRDTDALVSSSLDMLPDTASATLKVWAESPDKARVEVVNASLPDATGAKMVYDGTKVYAYSPKHNKVYIKTPHTQEEMSGKMSGMGMLGDWATMTPEERGDKLLAASDIKMLGSEQLDGKETYKLEITPKPGALEQLGLPAMFQLMGGSIVNSLKATVWVDKARFVPLKATLEHPQIGQFTYSATLDLDTPIDPAQFVLQTPAGAETVDCDALQERTQPKSMTLPQARDEVAKDGWKLLEPTYLPEKATLVEVMRVPGRADYDDSVLPIVPSSDIHHFSLKYSSPTTDFTITESKAAIEKGLGDGFSGVNGGDKAMKEITVRGVKAVAFSPDGSGWTSLHWHDTSGVFVSISGKLSLEKVLKIAEGLR